MAYCDTDDVQARVGAYAGFTIGVSTNPSTTEVGEFIDQTDDTLDGYLRAAGYTTVPVTGTDDLNVVKNMVANKVALQVLYIALGPKSIDEATREALGGWREWLKDIKSGDFVLPDQSLPSATYPDILQRSRRDAYQDAIDGTTYTDA